MLARTRRPGRSRCVPRCPRVRRSACRLRAEPHARSTTVRRAPARWRDVDGRGCLRVRRRRDELGRLGCFPQPVPKARPIRVESACICRVGGVGRHGGDEQQHLLPRFARAEHALDVEEAQRLFEGREPHREFDVEGFVVELVQVAAGIPDISQGFEVLVADERELAGGEIPPLVDVDRDGEVWAQSVTGRDKRHRAQVVRHAPRQLRQRGPGCVSYGSGELQIGFRAHGRRRLAIGEQHVPQDLHVRHRVGPGRTLGSDDVHVECQPRDSIDNVPQQVRERDAVVQPQSPVQQRLRVVGALEHLGSADAEQSMKTHRDRRGRSLPQHNHDPLGLGFAHGTAPIRPACHTGSGLSRCDHAVLPREQPEAEVVVSPADDPVVVEVESAGDAGVGGGGEEVREVDGGRAVLRDTGVAVTEKRCGETVLDVVELVDEDDVRVGPLDELGDDPGLGVPRRAQVTDQIACRVAVQRWR